MRKNLCMCFKVVKDLVVVKSFHPIQGTKNENDTSIDDSVKKVCLLEMRHFVVYIHKLRKSCTKRD